MAERESKKRGYVDLLFLPLQLSWRLIVWFYKGIFKSQNILLQLGYGVLAIIVLVMAGTLLQSIGVLPTTEELDSTKTAEAGTEVAMAQVKNSIETATEAAIVAPTETALASITPTLTSAPTATLTETNTSSPPTNTPWPTATPRSTTLYVQSGTANARECPESNDSTCPVLEVLAAGTDVSGIALVGGTVVSGSDQWWQVKYRGRDMYIHSSLLSTTRPVVQPQSSGGSTSSGGNTSTSGNTGAPAPPPQGRPGNCATAVAMGLDAVQAAQWDHLDRDNDGVACYGD